MVVTRLTNLTTAAVVARTWIEMLAAPSVRRQKLSTRTAALIAAVGVRAHIAAFMMTRRALIDIDASSVVIV